MEIQNPSPNTNTIDIDSQSMTRIGRLFTEGKIDQLSFRELWWYLICQYFAKTTSTPEGMYYYFYLGTDPTDPITKKDFLLDDITPPTDNERKEYLILLISNMMSYFDPDFETMLNNIRQKQGEIDVSTLGNLVFSTDDPRLRYRWYQLDPKQYISSQIQENQQSGIPIQFILEGSPLTQKQLTLLDPRNQPWKNVPISTLCRDATLSLQNQYGGTIMTPEVKYLQNGGVAPPFIPPSLPPLPSSTTSGESPFSYVPSVTITTIDRESVPQPSPTITLVQPPSITGLPSLRRPPPSYTWFDFYLGPRRLERGQLVFYRTELERIGNTAAIGIVQEYDTDHFDITSSGIKTGEYPTRLVVTPILPWNSSSEVVSIRIDNAFSIDIPNLPSPGEILPSRSTITDLRYETLYTYPIKGRSISEISQAIKNASTNPILRSFSVDTIGNLLQLLRARNDSITFIQQQLRSLIPLIATEQQRTGSSLSNLSIEEATQQVLSKANILLRVEELKTILAQISTPEQRQVIMGPIIPISTPSEEQQSERSISSTVVTVSVTPEEQVNILLRVVTTKVIQELQNHFGSIPISRDEMGQILASTIQGYDVNYRDISMFQPIVNYWNFLFGTIEQGRWKFPGPRVGLLSEAYRDSPNPRGVIPFINLDKESGERGFRSFSDQIRRIVTKYVWKVLIGSEWDDVNSLLGGNLANVPSTINRINLPLNQFQQPTQNVPTFISQLEANSVTQPSTSRKRQIESISTPTTPIKRGRIGEDIDTSKNRNFIPFRIGGRTVMAWIPDAYFSLLTHGDNNNQVDPSLLNIIANYDTLYKDPTLQQQNGPLKRRVDNVLRLLKDNPSYIQDFINIPISSYTPYISSPDGKPLVFRLR